MLNDWKWQVPPLSPHQIGSHRLHQPTFWAKAKSYSLWFPKLLFISNWHRTVTESGLNKWHSFSSSCWVSFNQLQAHKKFSLPLARLDLARLDVLTQITPGSLLHSNYPSIVTIEILVFPFTVCISLRTRTMSPWLHSRQWQREPGSLGVSWVLSG